MSASPCQDQLLCGIYCTGKCQQPQLWRPPIVTYADLKAAEIEMNLWAAGRIGGPQDFIDAAHHFLDPRVPIGFRLEVGWVNDRYEIMMRPSRAPQPRIEVDDRL